MIKLNPLIKDQFKLTLQNYHTSLLNPPLSNERDFIDRTIRNFNRLNFTVGNQSLRSRSKKIHLTPMVRFFMPSNKSTPVEMGDLLFVCKYFLNGSLCAHRATIIQAKFTKAKKKSWKIDTSQFYFLTQWPCFSMVRPRSNKSYYINPKAKTWSTYGFVGSNTIRCPLYYSAERILYHKGGIPPTKSFSFTIPSYTGWDSGTSFFIKFVQGLIGENLLVNTAVKALVDDLYIMAGWKPDPPGDLEWDNKESENEIFGIVEFTVTVKEREE